MGLKVGIIGFPNVDKSTIFNALTKSTVPSENYPFCTIAPNVEIPDSRLNNFANIFNPKKIYQTQWNLLILQGSLAGRVKVKGWATDFYPTFVM